MSVKEEVHMAETECLRSKEYPKVVVIGKSKGESWYSVSRDCTFFHGSEKLKVKVIQKTVGNLNFF